MARAVFTAGDVVTAFGTARRMWWSTMWVTAVWHGDNDGVRSGTTRIDGHDRRKPIDGRLRTTQETGNGGSRCFGMARRTWRSTMWVMAVWHDGNDGFRSGATRIDGHDRRKPKDGRLRTTQMPIVGNVVVASLDGSMHVADTGSTRKATVVTAVDTQNVGAGSVATQSC